MPSVLRPVTVTGAPAAAVLRLREAMAALARPEAASDLADALLEMAA